MATDPIGYAGLGRLAGGETVEGGYPKTLGRHVWAWVGGRSGGVVFFDEFHDFLRAETAVSAQSFLGNEIEYAGQASAQFTARRDDWYLGTGPLAQLHDVDLRRYAAMQPCKSVHSRLVINNRNGDVELVRTLVPDKPAIGTVDGDAMLLHCCVPGARSRDAEKSGTRR